MEMDFAMIGQGLILGAILWVGRTTLKTRESLVRVETILTGPDGSNGLVTDVKAVRAKNHELTNSVHALGGKQDLLEQRIGQLEEKRA